jgi:subtilisin family serine protease
VYADAIRGFSATMSEQDALAIAADPSVAFVEEDAVMEAFVTQNNATWGLDRIDQRNRPLSTTYTYTRTGSGVTAYVIDTGIRRTHTQFGGRAVHGFTAINDGRGSLDCNGHGTHVAGTIGGSTYGVAKQVRLVAVRVLSCSGSGSTSGVISGVNFVSNNHALGAPAVANMSLGGGISSALDTAVNNSINDGVTYAVAAGNSNANAGNFSPARVAAAITVGSSTITDARSSFSNFGGVVDIFAPGSSITSAWSTSDTATRTISGTSMATPHVAGVAARYLQGNPGASPGTVRTAIVGDATLNVLTGIPSGTANRLLFRAGTN